VANAIEKKSKGVRDSNYSYPGECGANAGGDRGFVLGGFFDRDVRW